MEIEYLRDCPPSPPDSGYISPTCFSSVKQSHDFRSRLSNLSSKRQIRRMEAWPTRRRLSCKYPLTPVSITDSYQDRTCFDDFSSPPDPGFSMCLRSHGLRNDILLTPPSPTLDNLEHQSLTDVEMLLPKSSTPVSPTSSKVQLSCRLRSRLSDRIKPRNLNLGTKPRRALPDFTGREHVDILGSLGEKSYHTIVVSKILGYLSPQDLCACSMVSKTWQRVLYNDTKAKIRYLNNIRARHHLKENLAKVKSAKKTASQSPTSPKIRYARKGLFVQVQNLPKESQKVLSSPPVSPSKVKFHSYVKVRDLNLYDWWKGGFQRCYFFVKNHALVLFLMTFSFSFWGGYCSNCFWTVIQTGSPTWK